MNQNIIDTYHNSSIDEIDNAIHKMQKFITTLQDELSTLKVIKVKKEMGINYMTAREPQRQYQRQYYLQRKQGKKQKVYGINKPLKLVSKISDEKFILEI